MKKLRVGINARVLANKEVRGWTRYTAELLRALSRRDDVELILFTREPLFAGHMRGIDARVVTLTGGGETAWSEWILPRAIAFERLDVFHAPADRGIPFRKPCAMVVTLHNSLERARWRQFYPTLKSRLWYWRNDLANYFRADALITVSDTALEQIARARIAPRNRLRRIYPAFAAAFSPNPQPGDETVTADIGGRYILYVGGYDEHKNVDALVRAFDRAETGNLKLVIAAKKDERFRKLLPEWNELRKSDRMVFLDPAPAEVPALFRHAHAFVNPSIWESFSFQVLEAMASGVPLASSDRGAMPEVAGGGALLFDPGDSATFAGALTRISNDEPLRQRLRATGLERAAGFSWERTAAETVDAYRWAIKRFSGKE